MKRFLPIILPFLICFFGGMSFAPAVKDSKARFDITSECLPPGEDSYNAWKKWSEDQKNELAKAGAMIKEADEKEKNDEKMKDLLVKIKAFEEEFKTYQKSLDNPEKQKLDALQKSLTEAKEKFDSAKKELLNDQNKNGQKKSFAEKKDSYKEYSAALLEFQNKLKEIPTQ